MINKSDYVDLGLACADVCCTIRRGMEINQGVDFSQSESEAIARLTKWVQPTVDIVDDPFTVLSIAGLSRRSREKSSRRGGGIYFPDSPTRRTTKR